MLATIVTTLPACIFLFKNCDTRSFIRVLAITSLSFFLFSVQEDEKSILLPLLPITMMYDEEPLFVIWFNNAAVYSLYPLLNREGSGTAYFAVIILWNMMTYSEIEKGKKTETLLVVVLIIN